MLNSPSTEECSLTKSTETKLDVDEKENNEEDEGFKEFKDKRKMKKEITNSRKSSWQCFIRNIFEKYGSLFIFNTNNLKVFISKLRVVNFPMNKEIFEKGKKDYDKEIVDEYNIPDIKFWNQRYYYYSKFDDGIKMDYESWYSVTPEELAKYIALAITDKNSVVVDAFCGSGGNVIQFSKHCKYVYAVDIDPNKIQICKNNCQVYKCENNIEFILSDFLKMENKIKADYIFLSPPWGGVEYKDSEFYSMRQMITPDIRDIIKVCLSIGKKIIFYLPRTIMIIEFFNILNEILKDENLPRGRDINSINIYDHIFIDIHILNSANKIKAVMLIFGNDIEQITEIEVKHYIKFYYKSINTNNFSAMMNILKVVGNAKFLRAEFSFRRNLETSYKQSGVNLRVKNLIKFFKDEIMTSIEITKLDLLNRQTLMKQKSCNQSDCNYSFNKNEYQSPHKEKSYFVDGQIMTEDEFHKYRDNLNINFPD